MERRMCSSEVTVEISLVSRSGYTPWWDGVHKEDSRKWSKYPELRPFLMALTDLDFRHKFVIDNPETPPYGPMFTNFGLLATFQLGAASKGDKSCPICGMIFNTRRRLYQRRQYKKECYISNLKENFNLATVCIRSPKRICQITNLWKKIV